ncbi:MAG: L,D-transpeptidase [Lachnospiraceae bacterium]|nr:L,D-transpeptidase [Lachnospiraceae bacterium]
MKKFWIRTLTVIAVLFSVLAFGKINTFAAPLAMPDGTVFDPIFYADSNADLKAIYGYDGGALWKHYSLFGKNEGRICTDGNPAVGSVLIMPDGTLFDANFYVNTYPELATVVGTDFNSLWAHYSRFGRAEGRLGYPGQYVASRENINLNAKYPFYIKVNRAAATVTIYAMDNNGFYSIPYKACVCSPGRATPIGVFRSGMNARWLAFEKGQYGQYSKNITKDFWFHSVMYNGKDESALDWPAYNRLGTICSHGCVRLQAGDAYWIYTNCPVGTTVEIYDDAANPGPLGKPEAMKIGGGDPRRGWDPTDPNPANPWNIVPEAAPAAAAQ